MKAFLGVDTSNYTTSLAVAVCDDNGEIVRIFSQRRVLSVELGAKGLRQSEAHFNHTKRIPELSRALMAEFRSEFPDTRISAVGYSDKPRNAEGSYMPCFLAGASAAIFAAETIGVEAYPFSHQCMHIASALYSVKREDLYKKDHLAFHVSGGTTELLYVRPERHGFDCSIIGKTMDISAGQLIDRVGVMLGLMFPCGAELEAIASHTPAIKAKNCTRGTEINFSGVENICTKLYEDGTPPSDIARYVFDTVALSLTECVKNALELYPEKTAVFVGGVSGNTIIKEYIQKRFDAEFALDGLSSDNAVGTAILASRRYFGR